MSSPQPTDAAVQQQQSRQQAITALLTAGMAAAWALLDVNDLTGSLPRYQMAVAALVRKYGQVSASTAAKFYITERDTARVAGRFRPVAAPTAPVEQVQSAIGWATKGLWQAEPDIASAKTLTNGVAQKLVVDSGRNTLIAAIQADTKCRGWARIARPDACSFCALLSTRGAVYRSEDTAKFQAHDHCHCVPVPLFADHYEPPAHVRAWQQLYRDTPYGANAGQARNNFRVALDKQRTGSLAAV